MLLTFVTPATSFALDLSPTMEVGDVLALCHTELHTSAQLALVHNGRTLSGGTLGDAGVVNNDVLHVTGPGSSAPAGSGVPSTAAAAPSRAGTAGRGRGRGAARGGLLLPRGTPAFAQIDPSVYPSLTWSDLPNVTPDTLYEILKVNTNIMKEIEKRDPAMHAAAATSAAALRGLIMERQLQHALPEAERAARMRELEMRLQRDPFDAEAQALLEAEIQRKNVEENLELAYEHMPESFARVTMLYVDGQVNGHPLKIFVDSGAQNTIMSRRCAERCGIMRLVDTKYSGFAVGVGRAAIVGRVHMAHLKIGEHNFPCTFTVLEQNDMEMLLGLDMLKRYQCCIDLERHVLRLKIGDARVEVPFLGEADIPKGVLGAEDEEMKDNSAPASGAGNSTHASGSGSGGSNAAAGSSQPRAGAGGVSSASSASTPAPAPASSAGGSLFANIDLSALGSGGRGGAGSGGGSSGGIGATVAPPVNNRGGAAMRGAGTPNPHTASTATADPAAIAVLMGMGFSREKCLAALAMANGDVSLAAGLLPDL